MKWPKFLSLDYDRKVIFTTKLSTDECLKRLEDTVDTNVISSVPGRSNKKILCRIEGHSFRLQKQSVRDSANPFAPLFYAAFIQETNGTKIEGNFSMYGLSKWFSLGFLIWSTFATGNFFAISIINLCIRISNENFSIDDLYIAIFSILPLMGVSGFLVAAKWDGGKEITFIEDFLKKTFECKPIPENNTRN